MTDKDKRTTQSKNEYFLLDFPVKDFTGKKLPSNRKVLGVFIKHHVIEKMALRKSATKTARKTYSHLDRSSKNSGKVWASYKISNRGSLSREESLKEATKSKDTSWEKKEESTFVDNLDDLFDISLADALDMIVL